MDLGRENILGRVRAALRAPAPRPASVPRAPLWPATPDFRAEFAKVRGEWISTGEELQKFLASFKRIATDDSDFVRRFASAGNCALRDCELAVTGCDCLVAQTGSIVVSGARALSVLPAAHLVIATRDQILPDLDAAISLLRRRYDGRWPTALSVITGPSRTADIEKILVMGAHGPKRLALYLAD